MDNTLSITYRHMVDTADIELPVSKSIAARAMMMAAYYHRPLPHPDNPCEDLRNLLRALQNTDHEIVDVGESGTAYRFMASYLAQLPGRRLLTGAPRLLQRPILPLLEALKSLGADIQITDNGLIITGKQLSGRSVQIAATESSQYVSSLLLLAPTLPYGLTIALSGPTVSSEYIAMTVKMLRQAGVVITTSGNILHIAHATNIHPAPEIERDWSAAGYFFEIEAITGTQMVMSGLKEGLQGDSYARELFSTKPHTVTMNATPDLVPAYAAMMCAIGKPFVINDIGHLRLKESDRLTTLSLELGHLGYDVRYSRDALSWEGSRSPSTHRISSHNDHRIVMALTPLAAVVGEITVVGSGAVNKSFPAYFDQLRRCGYDIHHTEAKDRG